MDTTLSPGEDPRQDPPDSDPYSPRAEQIPRPGGAEPRVPPDATPVVIVYGPELAAYAFSDEHPLRADRYILTMDLLHRLGWLDEPGLTIEPPRPATLSELLAVHSYPYIQAVQLGQTIARGLRPPADLSLYGLGTLDDPLFPDIHDAAALYTGATIQAVAAVVEGRALYAYNPAGGEHHAHRTYASGFCVYNDAAAAIAVALAAGRSVAYLDFDAHHADGVQAAFYDEPRVLTVSVHESGDYLFPGTGDVRETGRGEGLGTSVNIPLPPHAGDEIMLLVFDRVVAPAVRAFCPDLLLVQTGADTHHADPLTHLNATMALYPELGRRVRALAHECCSGRLVVVGGGGYDPADVTPRAWAAFFGAVLGHDVGDVALPAEWVKASMDAGGDPPARLLDDRAPRRAAAGADAFLPALEEMELAIFAVLHGRGSESGPA